MDWFYNLKQEQMTMEECMDMFDRLAKYAPGVVPNEASRAWKFKQGLKPEIRDKMSGNKWTNLRKAYEAALSKNSHTNLKLLLFSYPNPTKSLTCMRRPWKGRRRGMKARSEGTYAT